MFQFLGTFNKFSTTFIAYLPTVLYFLLKSLSLLPQPLLFEFHFSIDCISVLVQLSPTK